MGGHEQDSFPFIPQADIARLEADRLQRRIQDGIEDLLKVQRLVHGLGHPIQGRQAPIGQFHPVEEVGALDRDGNVAGIHGGDFHLFVGRASGLTPKRHERPQHPSLAAPHGDRPD